MKMDKFSKGAWIVHHGKKINGMMRAGAEYSSIDLAAKSATLLARMAESSEATLSKNTVIALAKIGGMNPKIELEPCLNQLKEQRVIDIATTGEVIVLGVNSRGALGHAAELFEKNEPTAYEEAAIELGELTSNAPVLEHEAKGYIGDLFKLSSAQSTDFMTQASAVGFVDSDGEGTDRLLFNGNLFRRDTVSKTMKVLSSLKPSEQSALRDLESYLKSNGVILTSEAERRLGIDLLSKLRAAAVFDENIVANERGEHSFITLPGSFHKYSNPLEDDAFDHAKALVAALSYGMSQSSDSRGRIWGVSLLLRKLLRGQPVGPAHAIGNDYRALEYERVVQINQTRPGRFTMRLLKMEVGQIALNVLQGGDSSETVLNKLPGAAVSTYMAPEESRTNFRKKSQGAGSRSHIQTLLRSVRSEGGL